jgi:hypothetical protein
MKREKKEMEFCENTLKPILEAMPHIERLKYTHGNMEFGKDLTFSYVNPLNQRINVGWQAKWGDIKGSSTTLISKIVDQIRTAFGTSYDNKPYDTKLYLNELYLVCSGKFRGNAIKIIEDILERKYNVHFLDGSDIADLRKKVTAHKTKEKIETERALNALLIELDQNINWAKEIYRDTEKTVQNKKHYLSRFRLNCLEKVLELDIDDKWIRDEATIQWQILTVRNKNLDEIGLVLTSDEHKQKMKRDLGKNLREDTRRLEKFKEYITSYLKSAYVQNRPMCIFSNFFMHAKSTKMPFLQRTQHSTCPLEKTNNTFPFRLSEAKKQETSSQYSTPMGRSAPHKNNVRHTTPTRPTKTMHA